ncbi:MAG: ATP-binding protein [Campylobacterota bacterium]
MNGINSFDFYEKILANLPVGVFVINKKNKNILYINENAKKLLDFEFNSFDEVDIEKTFICNSNIKQTVTLEDLIKRITSTESIEYRIYMNNKNLTPVEIRHEQMSIDNKELILLNVSNIQKTQRKINLLNYYDKALEKSSSFLALVDKNYKYLWVNDYYAKVYNKKKSYFTGKSLAEVLGDNYFQKIAKENFDKALNGESIEFESKLKLFDKTIYIQVFYEPYYTITNEIEGVVVLVYDLSKFKEYEKEDKKKEKLLIQQSKMAAMGEMLQNIAHQWRQPLSVISTCTSGIMLQKDYNALTDDILYDSLKNIMNTTNYLSNTIDDFKNFFERDNVAVEFNVKDLVLKSLDLVDMSFSSKDIKLEKSLDENIQIVNYKNEFMQVILNILNNAKDALLVNNDDINQLRLIKIDLYKTEDKVVLDVLDNAGGIPKRIKEKIFEPYFTTKHKSQGTGIGLFMTQEIIEKHMDGNIKATNKSFEYEDNNYKGALFTISLSLS